MVPKDESEPLDAAPKGVGEPYGEAGLDAASPGVVPKGESELAAEPFDAAPKGEGEPNGEAGSEAAPLDEGPNGEAESDPYGDGDAP